MRRTIINGFMAFALGVMTAQITPAQGTITYLSNLGQPSTGSYLVASDSPARLLFLTGTSPGGYVFQSVQLAMADASGNPSHFTVLINAIANRFTGAETNIGTLSGSLNPATGGIYTYTPTANVTLLPSGLYSIVLAAGTAVADGAYEWNFTSTLSSNARDGWLGPGFDGFSIAIHFPQYAIAATPIPEPGVLGLFVLGGLGFLWHRRKAKAV